MRDKIKDENYFRNFIKENEERVQRFKNKLETGQIREDRIDDIKEEIIQTRFKLLIARYSYGSSVEEIKSFYLEIIEDIPSILRKTTSQVDLLWYLSLGILLNVDNDRFKKLSDHIEKIGRKDSLLSFLIDYKLNNQIERVDDDIVMKNPYEKLKEIVNNADKRESLLQKYIAKDWYKGHKIMAWYDNHKSTENLYFGYWSFEAGAIAKILKIDDSNLREMEYYPFDLVHFED